MSNINKIRLSGTTYDIQDSNATKTVTLTQAQYDALATKDANTFYIISDAQGADLSNYTTTATTDALNTVVTAHTADTSIHVTSSDKATWNGKSDFSGSYNDLTDKPTIPTVPTSNTAFTNDAGYITSNDISGKVDTSAVTTSVTSASTDSEIPTAKAVYDAIPTGGTSITIDPSLDSGSTNPVANSAITNVVTITDIPIEKFETSGTTYLTLNKSDKITKIKVWSNSSSSSYQIGTSYAGNNNVYTSNQYLQIGDESNYAKAYVDTTDTTYGSYCYVFEAKEGYWIWGTSSFFHIYISNPISSVKTVYYKTVAGGLVNEVLPTVVEMLDEMEISTEEKVNTVSAATAANTTALGGLSLVKLTQSEYDALSEYDDNTVYFVGDSTNGYTMKIGNASVS